MKILINMKKYIYALLALTALSFFFSCRRASELPPLNEGYAKNVILPEPVDLTAEDRAYLEALEQEYQNGIK